MSLLLEALKKAEKAKEEAQRRAQAGAQESATLTPHPALEPQAPPQEEPGAVRTREHLPEIREPLELLGEESVPEKNEEPARAFIEERPRPDAQAAERAAARKVFEAKFRAPNPRLPFFITLGALGVFAVGTVVYFWMQLRPPAPLVNLNPQPAAADVQVAAAAPPKPAPQTTTLSSGAIPGLPAASAVIAPKPAALPVPEMPLIKPQPRTITPAPRLRAPAETEITTSRLPPQVHPKVGSAYAAYLAGDLKTARADYQQALHEEPANRDALLGLAALDVRSGRLEAAEGGYLRLLQADPRDAHAQAALIALRAGRVDPVTAESRVKLMLADNPAAHVLNFTLGNQLAQQGRWAEAQHEYFKAFSAEPDNADFAYNLAVSLDHLRQPKLALEYYRRALALGKTRGASFDAAAAEARVTQLAR